MYVRVSRRDNELAIQASERNGGNPLSWHSAMLLGSTSSVVNRLGELPGAESVKVDPTDTIKVTFSSPVGAAEARHDARDLVNEIIREN